MRKAGAFNSGLRIFYRTVSVFQVFEVWANGRQWAGDVILLIFSVAYSISFRRLTTYS